MGAAVIIVPYRINYEVDTLIDNRIYNSRVNCTDENVLNLPSPKMADTSKDELLFGGGINRITTTSRRSKQVPACVSNIV